MRTVLGLLKKLLLLVIVLVVAALVAALVLPLPGGAGKPAASFAGPDGRFIDIGATSTYVVTAGPADGPAVVLVHGFGGSTYSWRYTSATLASAGYRVVAMDLRGFGLTGKAWDADYSHPAQARLVLSVMDAVGVKSAVLVGHSMGGNVVAQAAQIAPDRVRALVLVDAAVVAPEASASPLSGIPGAVLGVAPVRRIAQFAVRLGFGGDTLEKMLRSAYADSSFPTTADVAAYGLAEQITDWDIALLGVIRDAGKNALPAPVADLSKGRPVLVAWGEKDPWIPIATGEALRVSIPGSQWLVVPGAGHLPMEEGRAGFEPGLLAFLASLPKP